MLFVQINVSINQPKQLYIAPKVACESVFVCVLYIVYANNYYELDTVDDVNNYSVAHEPQRIVQWRRKYG